MISLGIFAILSLFVIDGSVSFFSAIRLTAFLLFLYSFCFYSYLRGIVLFGDYVKTNFIRNVLSSMILFVNFFTCITLTLALLYIHFFYQ